MTFLPQIEGLRALAVLAVLAFHYSPNRVPGGFLGVDIFYVISGFLITQIILRAQADNRFSLIDFYRRRILRLGPAIALVIGVSVVFGWFVLFPDEYAHLGKSTLASSFFLQNFNLLSEGGYFDEHAELKVFLHLWSLSVEMQFYLFWGLIIYLLRWRPNLLLAAGVFLTILSVASLAFVGPGSKEMLFYLPNFRFWEFSIGCLVSILSARRRIWTVTGAGLFQFATVVLLVGVIFAASDKQIIPAILSSVAITAMLLFSITAGAAIPLLTNRIAVFIGRISYPLYMWHWPLLVYARIIESETPSRGMRIGLVIASFVLASATYLLLERPLSRLKNKRRLAGGLVAAFAVLGFAGAVIAVNDGFPGRSTIRSYAARGDLNPLEKPPRLFACGQDILRAFTDLSDCVTTGSDAPTRLLVGDSHAKQLIVGLSVADANSTWMILSQNSCPPVRGVQFFIDSVRMCPEFGDELVRFVRTRALKTVVIAFASTYLQTTSYNADHKLARNGPETFKFTADGKQVPNADAFYVGLKAVVSQLQAIGIDVWIVADNFELPFTPKSCIGRPLKWTYNAECSVPIAEARQRQKPMFEILDRLRRELKIGVIDVNEMLCDAVACHARLNGQVVYRDSHHVNDLGSVILAGKIVEALKK